MSSSAEQQSPAPIPVDVDTIETTLAHAAVRGTCPPRYEDLLELHVLLRGHIGVLLPEVEVATERLPLQSPTRLRRRARLLYIRTLLEQTLGDGLMSAHGHVQQLGAECGWLLGRYRAARQTPLPRRQPRASAGRYVSTWDRLWVVGPGVRPYEAEAPR